MVKGPVSAQGMAVESNGLLVQPQRRLALQPPSSQFSCGAGIVACIVRGVIWPSLAAALASTLLPVNFVAGTERQIRQLTMLFSPRQLFQDWRPTIRLPMSADLERDVRLLDLDLVLLTESCGFISCSALESHSSGADPENSERKKRGAPQSA